MHAALGVGQILKDSWIPADTLQATFTLEISSSVMVCASSPVETSVRAVDRQFPCSPAGIAQVLLVSVLSSMSHHVSEWGWKEILLVLHLPAVRPGNPKGALPLCRAWIHHAPALQGAAIPQDTPFSPISLLSRDKLLSAFPFHDILKCADYSLMGSFPSFFLFPEYQCQ